MWCDYGGALFWNRDKTGDGACCGDFDSIFTETVGEIKLDSIKGLREWYDEYDSTDSPHNWNSKRWKNWLERGYSFALQVRKLLPDTIDLFYYNWYPKKKVVRKKIEYLKNKYFEYKERYPMIVFNERCLMENKI